MSSSQTTLGISWFNNQFKAVAAHRGTVTGAWAHVCESANVNEFEALLREAIQKTGFRGSSVSLVLAQSWSAQQMVDLPPVKGPALKKILARQAQQQKFFVGEAAWSFEESGAERDSRRIILHLVPKAALNQLITACHTHGLHLVSVVPPSTIFQQQLRKLPLEKQDVAMLAGETGGATTIVIGRNDGRILLARTLHGTWKEGGERLALDLNRTILFASQKYGIALTKDLWLYGPDAPAQADSVQPHLQISVSASPVEYDPFYAATRALALRPQLSSNFISPVMQKAHQRDLFAKAVLAMTVFAVVASLAVTCFAFVLARQNQASIRQLTDQYQRLESQRGPLEKLKSQLALDQHLDKTVLEERPPPVPLWLFAALSEAVPTGCTVTNFHVKRQGDSWQVQLAGDYLGEANADKANIRAQLVARLSSGPFHMNLVEGDAKRRKSAGANGSGGVSDWLANLGSAPVAKAGEPEARNFEIEGVVR